MARGKRATKSRLRGDGGLFAKKVLLLAVSALLIVMLMPTMAFGVTVDHQTESSTQDTEQVTIIGEPFVQTEDPANTSIQEDSALDEELFSPFAVEESQATITSLPTPAERPPVLASASTITTTPGIFKPTAKQIVVAAAAEKQEIPVINVLGMPVPLTVPEGTSDFWSLLNLIATILCVLLLIVASFRILLAGKKKVEQRDYKEFKAENEDSPNKKVRVRRIPIFIVSVLIAASAVALFILTQDTELSIVLYDMWSIAFIAALSISISAAVLCAGKRLEAHS